MIAEKSHLELYCNILDDDGSLLYQTDNDGFLPIHTAARFGQINIVKESLKRDAKLLNSITNVSFCLLMILDVT